MNIQKRMPNTIEHRNADNSTYPMFPGAWSNLYNEDKQNVRAICGRLPAYPSLHVLSATKLREHFRINSKRYFTNKNQREVPLHFILIGCKVSAFILLNQVK